MDNIHGIIIISTGGQISTEWSIFNIKVAYTSGQIFEKIMKRYPIFSW